MSKEILKRIEAAEKELVVCKSLLTKKEGPVTDRIKSFEDAVEELNIKTYGDAYRLLKMNRKMFADTPIELCDDPNLRRCIIAKALQEDWEADWTDGKPKWWCYFEYDEKTSGFGFSSTNFDFWGTCTAVGSRLSFPNETLAKYFGKNFTKEHNDYLLLNK